MQKKSPNLQAQIKSFHCSSKEICWITTKKQQFEASFWKASEVVPAVLAALAGQVHSWDFQICLDIMSLIAACYITLSSTQKNCNKIWSAKQNLLPVSLLACLTEAGESFTAKESDFVLYKPLFWEISWHNKQYQGSWLSPLPNRK